MSPTFKSEADSHNVRLLVVLTLVSLDADEDATIPTIASTTRCQCSTVREQFGADVYEAYDAPQISCPFLQLHYLPIS
jgi:hypothetical protein